MLREFFGSDLGKKLADEGKSADLIVGNNVYAHVPDIKDFTIGLKNALKPGGTITLEFPHVARSAQAIRHGLSRAFSYLPLFTVARIFRAAGLKVWRGGNPHTRREPAGFVAHRDDPRDISANVTGILANEAMGLQYGYLHTFSSRWRGSRMISYASSST